MDRTPAYVADMLDATSELIGFVQGLTLDQFLADRLRCLAVEKLFINLGEAARRVDAADAVLIQGVPWSRIIGLRNILAHGYEQIEHEVLYKTITVELPSLVDALAQWLSARPAP